MSLKLWLPLNGNTNNQGLLDADLKVTNASFENGKFGKCLKNGKIIIPAVKTAEVLNNQSLTIAFWIYVNADTESTTNTEIIFGNNSMSENNNRKFSLFQYPTCNDFHWSWMNDTASKVFMSDVITGILPSYEWTHVAVTYENPNACIYINGKLKQTFSGVSNSSSFAYDTTMIHDSQYHMFNDYRIYDNALSAKEVKLLSQGLICHYPLNGGGRQPENLVSGCYSCTSTNKEFKETYESKVSITLTTDDFIKNKGKTLCLSYKVKSNGSYTHGAESFQGSGTRFGFHTSFNYIDTSGNNRNNYYPLAELLKCSKEEGLYYTTWTPPTDIKEVTNFSLAVQTDPNNGFAYPADDNNETWYLKDVKLEWGEKPTTWCPNKNDSLYSALGYDSLKEYDTSGFNNHGTASTILPLNQDSPRYKYCYEFNGKDTFIACPTSVKVTDEITVSVWGYMEKWDGNQRLFSCTETGGYNIESNSGTECISFVVYASGSYRCCNGRKWDTLESGWHHFVATYNGLKSCLYIDGKLEKEETFFLEKTPISYRSSNTVFVGAEAVGSTSVGHGPYFNGSISDFRIYATALSTQDVQDLCGVSTSLTNNGTLMTQGEFIEE